MIIHDYEIMTNDLIYSLNEDPTVTIRFDASTFYIHRKLLCQASDFFRSAFTGDESYVENTTQSMTLSGTEVTLDALERLVEWLYTQSYTLSSTDSQEVTSERYMELARLFVLAEKYVIVDLKNDIIDQLFLTKKQTASPPPFAVVSYVYEHTPMNSPFRLLLVAHYTWHIGMKWYEWTTTPSHLQKFPDFAADLAVSFGKKSLGKQKSLFDGKPSDLYETSISKK